MMRLNNLITPCLILDIEKVKNNISSMNKHITGLGGKLRPHGKTAKNSEILRMACDDKKTGITVSTLKEAEYYFENRFNDILYAVGIVPDKLDRIACLIKKGAKITVILDSREQAELITKKVHELEITLPVLIEIDSDNHRSGVKPDSPELLNIGRLLNNNSNTQLQGVMTHAGGSYNSNSINDIKQAAEKERRCIVNCSETLKSNNLPCPIVSIGSTPTATYIENLKGVTEVRPGVYIFQDLVMAGIGVCNIENIALSVLTSVIGYQKEKNWLITDSGWMSLSRDSGTANQKVDQGYGLVCDINGNPIHDLIVSSTNQEHGIVSSRSKKTIDYSNFPIGTKLRILPNHACATAGMHDKYYIVESSTEIVKTLPRINGW